LPLYGAEKLKGLLSDSRVYLTEGEAACEALWRRGLAAVATVTGAGAIPCYDSLRDLRKFKVIRWPDNDDAGRSHMSRIGERLSALGIEHQQVDWPDSPPKGDAVEFFAFGGTIEKLEELISDGATTCVDLGPRLSEIEVERIEWLWDGRIVLGKLNILDGDPGLGKTMLALDIAARVTNGDTMPDGSPGIGPAGVVYFTAEDGQGDTLRPRLEAADGDARLVQGVTTIKYIGEDGKPVERMPTFRDLAIIKQATEAVGAKLVIFDPFMAYMSGGANSFRDQDVRAELAPLAHLAQERGVAVLFIRHLNKSSGGSALYRGGGSIGIIGAARSGLIVAQHPDDESHVVLSRSKGNFAMKPPDLEYSISANSGGVPFITWHGESRYSAMALVSATQSDGDGRSGASEAVDFLLDALAEGPRPSKELEAEARPLGITVKNLRNARQKLGIKPYRGGGIGSDGQWMYPRVAKPPDEPKMPESSKMPTSQLDGHLSAETGGKVASHTDSRYLAHAVALGHLSGHISVPDVAQAACPDSPDGRHEYARLRATPTGPLLCVHCTQPQVA
jgi:hypothetical protein